MAIDSEIEKRLDAIEKVTRENNGMLHKLRRAQIWANTARFIYWALIIGMGSAIYYWLGPTLSSLLETYTNMGNLFN